MSMKTVVVYYSMGGNVAWCAEKIAEKTGADVLRIEPEKAYPAHGFKKFLFGGKSALSAEAPKLAPYVFDAAAYDRVILGMPVWAGCVTPPMRTFIEENREALCGKSFAAFLCASGGAGKVFDKTEELLGSKLVAKVCLLDPKSRPKAENEEKLAAFCETCLTA